MQELRIALCHFLGHHLLPSRPGRGAGPAKLQEIVQLRLRRRMLLLMGMLLRVLMIMEDAIVHAGAIACGDHRIVIFDDATATAV